MFEAAADVDDEDESGAMIRERDTVSARGFAWYIWRELEYVGWKERE